MSDTFPKQRAFPANLDPRGRDGQAGVDAADPLAELARLVGRDDPFKDLFAAREPRKTVRADRIEPPAPPPPMLPTPEPFEPYAAAPGVRPVDDHPFGESAPSGRRDDPYHDEDERDFHAPLGQRGHESFRLPATKGGPAGYRDDRTDPFAAAPGEAPPLNADLWAQGMPEPVSSDPLHYAPAMDEADAPDGTRKRTLLVLAAVVALTAGGLGATFLVRGGSSGGSSGEPPTIMADTGPAKIQPPDTSNQATGGDGNTALIEKSASDNVANAKVVNTQERPVDLSQLPKAPDAATAPADGRVAVTTTSGGATAAGSAFPEPRKVKTVMIRPDGSVVGEANQAGAPTAPAPTDVVPKPATPKSTARATTTPHAAAAATDSAPVKPKPAPRPKPAAQAADAAPTAAVAAAEPQAASATPATSSTGSFAVQLAAPATEQEARDVSSRLQKKFAAELDGRTPSVRKADNKSVYRVRVGNLSKDDASALCDKLKAGGGSCFVVHN